MIYKARAEVTIFVEAENEAEAREMAQSTSTWFDWELDDLQDFRPNTAPPHVGGGPKRTDS